MQFNQSSPVQPITEFRRGTKSVTSDKVWINEVRKSLRLILDTAFGLGSSLEQQARELPRPHAGILMYSPTIVKVQTQYSGHFQYS